jgi:hypothetical protein
MSNPSAYNRLKSAKSMQELKVETNQLAESILKPKSSNASPVHFSRRIVTPTYRHDMLGLTDSGNVP